MVGLILSDRPRFSNACADNTGWCAQIVHEFAGCRAGNRLLRVLTVLLVAVWAGGWSPGAEAGLPETIARVKPGVVGIGTVHKLRSPKHVLLGTGFAVAKGRWVVTNAHVLPVPGSAEDEGKLAVFVGPAESPTGRYAKVIARDDDHDLALLEIRGSRVPPLKVIDSGAVVEGQRFAFTGFPIGMVLGLYPVTHEGIVSALTPIAVPAHHARELEPAHIHRLKQRTMVFQLDATAYPGNSGSPLYDPETGEVFGIINKVFVKGTKESILKTPSGITYAIPSRYIMELIEGAGGRP